MTRASWSSEDISRALEGKYGAERDGEAFAIVAAALSGQAPPRLNVQEWVAKARERHGVDLRVHVSPREYALVLVVREWGPDAPGTAYEIRVSDHELAGPAARAENVLDRALALLLEWLRP